MMKMLILDMYGVIIKESKGNFIPYTRSHFPEVEHERLMQLFKKDRLFARSQLGELTSDEFLLALGYADTARHMRDYIENYLTLDEGFCEFAEEAASKYRLALLSNDVAEWSRYICEYHGLDKYFSAKIVSGDVGCRKPDAEIYRVALERLGVKGEDCVFVDNSVANLRAAVEFGMDVVLFNRDDEEFEGKVVYSFGELLEIL